MIENNSFPIGLTGRKKGNMKIKNFKYFAKRFSKEIGTTIKRIECGKNAVWFDNGYYMEMDDDCFIYIADCSKDIPITIMGVYACIYNTQEVFFRKFKMAISSIEATESTTEPETSEEPEATESTSGPEATEETDCGIHHEKRQTYLSVYRDLQQTLDYLRKCKTLRTYDICIARYIRKVRMVYTEKKISKTMLHFIESKISMQNVESGIWSSEYEWSTGFHKSRRYNKNRVDA